MAFIWNIITYFLGNCTLSPCAYVILTVTAIILLNASRQNGKLAISMTYVIITSKNGISIYLEYVKYVLRRKPAG